MGQLRHQVRATLAAVAKLDAELERSGGVGPVRLARSIRQADRIGAELQETVRELLEECRRSA